MPNESGTRRELSLENRAALYRILADCYYPPDDRVVESLACLPRSIALEHPALGDMIEDLIAGLSTSGGPEGLQVDYSRLFLGPFSLLAPPYGSVYLEEEKKLMGESTVAVSDCYSSEGLALDDQFHDAPDHIATELEFLHYLCARQLQAEVDQDWQAAGRYQAVRRDFLVRHLGRWANLFADLIKKEAKTNFYMALAAITENFVMEELNGEH